jgi:hypothetical protein
MGTAASDGKIGLNPCVIRGAATTKRKHQIRPASLPELTKLTQAMPQRYAGDDPAGVLVRAAVRRTHRVAAP